ncbi:MAG: hypothetical protein KGL93_04270 [Gemmatimonadota bacterium]|nr:hypothetical protein [Gemmatimonadota bacterium]
MAQQSRVGRWGRAAAVIAIVSSAACYTQVPITDTSAPAGEPVHAVLTPYGSVQMVSKLGPNVHEVDGRLVSFDTSTVTIALATTVGLDGTQQDWSGDRIEFPRTVLDQLTTSRFSARKTTWLGVVTVAGLAVLRGVLGGTSLVGGGGSNSPPPTGK